MIERDKARHPFRQIRRRVNLSARNRLWNWNQQRGHNYALRNGQEIFIVSQRDNIIGREVWCNGAFGFHTLEIALKALKRQQINRLFDIGANIGTICIPAVNRGVVNQAFAFEPEPRNFRLLNWNVQLNGLDDKMHLYELALGSTDNETLFLELSETNFGDNRVIDRKSSGNNDTGSVIDVLSRTLDSLDIKIDPAGDLLWLDVQGYEVEVLRGAKKSIDTGVPIVMEFAPSLLSASIDLSDLEDVLSRYKYFFDLGVTKPRWEPISNLEPLWNSHLALASQTDVLFALNMT